MNGRLGIGLGPEERAEGSDEWTLLIWSACRYRGLDPTEIF